MHTIIGDEDEFADYAGSSLRVLAMCYNIRHALIGDREIEFVDNGIDADMMRYLSVITPEKTPTLRSIYFGLKYSS